MEEKSGLDIDTTNCSNNTTMEANGLESKNGSSEYLNNDKADKNEDIGNNIKEDKKSPSGESSSETYSGDFDYTLWDYTPDKSVQIDYSNMDPSQPCFNIRGVSYTPPGWKRRYHKCSNSDQEEVCAKKRLKYEEDNED